MALTVRYVDLTSGNDADTGGSGDPYLTYQAAHDDLPASGGMLIMSTGSGTLPASQDLNAANPPGADNRIIIRDWPGNPRPQIDDGGNAFQDDPNIQYLSLVNLDIVSSYSGQVLNFGAGADLCQIFGCSIRTTSSTHTALAGTTGLQMDSCFLDFATTVSAGVNWTSTGTKITNTYMIYRGDNWPMSVGTYGEMTGNIVECTHANAEGLLARNNHTSVFRNIVANTSGAATSSGIYALGVESNCMVGQNYVEGFDTNYSMANTRINVLDDNVSMNPVTTHFENVDGYVVNESNLQLTGSSWLMRTPNGLLTMRPERWLSMTGKLPTSNVKHAGYVLAQALRSHRARITKGNG